MSNICIIPARGGSKRIPRKNIKPFLGKPIIAYSIEAALESHLFDVVMVSTDDKEIAETAIKFGAEVPFMRSKETANDFATTADVLHEVLREYAVRGMEFDFMCCLYATAPFVSAQRLAEAFEMMKQKGYDRVFPVVQFSYPIQRCFVIGDDGCVVRKWPEYELSRSQDLEPTYHDAGQIYFHNLKSFLDGKKDKSAGIILSELEVQDLDTETDWRIAEMKCTITKQHMENKEKYIDVFVKTFGINPEVAVQLKYKDIPEWDSVGQLTLIANIEECFGITLDTDDIFDFNSFVSGVDILKRKGIIID